MFRSFGIIIILICSFHFMLACRRERKSDTFLFSSGSYTVYNDSIVDGDKYAYVLNPGTLVTNFNCTDTFIVSDTLKFRFAINADDNEMFYSSCHSQLKYALDSSLVHQFGVINNDAGVHNSGSVQNAKSCLIRLDMRPVLKRLKEDGYYVTKTGDTIYEENFNGVWVALLNNSLNTDFRKLYLHSELKMRDNGDSIYECTIPLENAPKHDFFKPIISVNELPESYPSFSSKVNILNAAYNIAINRLDSLGREIADKNVEISTSEISKTVLLTSGILPHELSKKLLKKCVEHGRIKHEASSTGGWPITSDRLIWACAAYDEFLVSADTAWLKYSYNISCRTLEDIEYVQLSLENSLLCGTSRSASTFQRTYPYWMGASEIFESQCLLSNVIYYRALAVLSKMAAIVGDNDKANEFEQRKNKVGYAINLNLWLPDAQRFSEYLYCYPYQINSESTDNLGQALSIMFGPATDDMSKAIVNAALSSPYGIQRCSPNNNIDASFGFYYGLIDSSTQAFWSMACTKTNDMRALALSNFSLLRNVLLSGFSGAMINPANGYFVYDEDYRQYDELMASAAVVALVYKVILGAEHTVNGISFHPCIVPQFGDSFCFNGLNLKGVKYDVIINGSGNNVLSTTVDDVNSDRIIATDNKGDEHKHNIVIDMAEPNRLVNTIESNELNVMPEVPIVSWDNKSARIVNFKSDAFYDLLVNGAVCNQIANNSYDFTSLPNCAFIQFQTVSNDIVGLASSPRLFVTNPNMLTIYAWQIGETGTMLPVRKGTENNFIEISSYKNKSISFKINSVKSGKYLMSVKYSNGAGEVNTQSQCAIRSVMVNGERAGTLIFPANGLGNWTKINNSNGVTLNLNKGLNQIKIEFIPPFDLNSSRSVGTALIESIRLIRLD